MALFALSQPERVIAELRGLAQAYEMSEGALGMLLPVGAVYLIKRRRRG